LPSMPVPDALVAGDFTDRSYLKILFDSYYLSVSVESPG
jgi:hypothetical protein